MRSFNMEVSKKENGAYVKQGDVTVFYPTLDEMGLDVQPTKFVKQDKDGKDIEAADGFPLYSDEKVQYVFDAVLAAVKASARNKLVSGTVTLKPDNKIAETIEELIAAAERNGAALALRREFFSALKDALPTVAAGKSQAFYAQLYDIIQNVKGIAAQSPARKALINQTVADFAATLSEEKLTAYARIIASIEEQLDAASELPE